MEQSGERGKERVCASEARIFSYTVIAKIDVSLKKLFLRTEIIDYRHCQVWVCACVHESTWKRKKEREREKSRIMYLRNIG